jgi:GTP cyclohydrolase IA
MLRHDSIFLRAGGSFPPAEDGSKFAFACPIPFHSLCAHHLLPFHGVACIGYIPGEKHFGLVELARVVEACSRGIQVQQPMTTRIGLWLRRQLAPPGVGVLVECVHTYMAARGVAPVSTSTTNYAVTSDNGTRCRRTRPSMSRRWCLPSLNKDTAAELREVIRRWEGAVEWSA